MGKGKLAKFADMATYDNVFQYPYSVVDDMPFDMQGHWHEQYFHNQNPIVVELGCGRGEYTVELARLYPDRNFIGVDIKGARMWTGATQALRDGLTNVAFLRTSIEIIDRFFSPGEVSQIWLTFSDPQMKNPRKRLTSTFFMERYRKILTDGGTIHLKTDSNFLYTYTRLMVERNALPLLCSTADLYGPEPPQAGQPAPELLSIQTYYEQMWRGRGISIKYLSWQLPAEGALEEPDVEIELDSYRSYHRDKRSPKETGK
ncbi:MAG: tRNA (guanosine(46)-N7)-methyltransferase TrmB [Prevotella sp.]|nr:tRNA (guanosine(46)-N7)-methyltransferase TrmB [Prevotella sp.]